MRVLAITRKEIPELAEAELRALGSKTVHKEKGTVLIDATPTVVKRITARAAMLRELYTVLFLCSERELDEKIKEYPWRKVYKNSFAVRMHGISHDEEQRLGVLVYRELAKKSKKEPRVNLSRPATKILFFNIGKCVGAGVRFFEAEEAFAERLPHTRAAFHPSTMHPRLAQAIVNSTGIRGGTQTLVDPMCGSGGFLIEAGRMGLRYEGVEIDKAMYYRCLKNIRQERLPTKTVRLGDATRINKKIHYVAVDLPYGKSTKTKMNALVPLYTAFLATLKKNLDGRAVVVFPHYVDYRTLLKKAGFRITEEFSNYLHRSLTRKIVVVEQRLWLNKENKEKNE